MVIYHIDKVILYIDMGHELMIWAITVSTWASSISIWDRYLVTLEQGTSERPCWLAPSIGWSRPAGAYTRPLFSST